MTKTEFQYYLTWIHLLAWHTLDACDLSNEARKTLGVFISHIKRAKFISGTNSLLKNVVRVIDEHSSVKSTDKPAMKDDYTKAERMAINKGVRQLHKTTDEGSPQRAFCQRYLYCQSGKRNTRVPSANKVHHAEMTLAVHAPENRP